MKKTDLLMIPGPTPLPDAVRLVLSSPGIGHRSADFKEILKRVFPALRWIFQCKNEVFLYTASGTGAMEAAIVNTLNAGDLVLVLVNGVFSQRWADIAKTLGVEVECLTVEPGQAITPEQLRAKITAHKGAPIKSVMMTHSETSTSVLSPLKELAAVSRELLPEALIIADTVTSLGAAPFQFDAWDLDIAVSGSQKGFMLPPGLSFLAYSDRAWKAHKACKNPGFYFNFSKYLKAQVEFTTPYTPGTNLITGLDVALSLMQEEGLDNLTARHRQLQEMTRAGLSAMGLELFVPKFEEASPSVTAFLPPKGITVDAVRGELKKTYGIVIADGQKELKGRIMRIGHLGAVSEREVLTVLSSLEASMIKLGAPIQVGKAIPAAIASASKEKVGAHA
jgi:aspartate aminotransferase-like enzyme